MKKSILILAILGAISGTAAAQSSVTIFGAVDVGVRSVTNDGVTLRSMSTSGYSPSAIGFRGVEDLGDGLSASFWLEGQTFVDTGTMDSTKFFGRRATMGLTGRFGEVRLGRDLNPSYLNLGTFDAFGNLGIGSNVPMYNAALKSGVNTVYRTDNAVSYFTPAMGGFYAHVMAAPSEGAATGGLYKAVRVGYADAKLNVSAATGSTTTGTSNDFTQTNVGASYDLGVAKVMGIYNLQKFGAAQQTLVGIGANVPFGDFWQLRASAQRATSSGVALEGNLYALGGVYLLSKRTALYGTASTISNNGASNLSVNFALPASATLMDRKSSGFEFGIRHGF